MVMDERMYLWQQENLQAPKPMNAFLYSYQVPSYNYLFIRPENVKIHVR